MQHNPLSRDRSCPTTPVRRSLRALAARSTRTLLAAAVLVSLSVPLAGVAPATAEARSPAGRPGLALGVMDDGDPAATAPPSPDGLVHLTVIPGDTEVRFVMRLRTLLQPPKSAACATRNVTGDIVLTQDGAVVSDLSKVEVDTKTLKCQPPLRDNMAQQLLETDKYPPASFLFQQAPGLTVPLPVGDTAFQFIGLQTVHGVTRPVQYDTTATFGQTDATGRSTSEMSMSAFNMKAPQIPPLIQVDDRMIVEFDFHVAISGPATADAGTGAQPAQ